MTVISLRSEKAKRSGRLKRMTLNWRVHEEYDFRLPQMKRMKRKRFSSKKIGEHFAISGQRVDQILEKAAKRNERDAEELISDTGLGYCEGLGAFELIDGVRVFREGF